MRVLFDGNKEGRVLHFLDCLPSQSDITFHRKNGPQHNTTQTKMFVDTVSV